MKKGFTLIELLIVVAIIGILSVALVPNLTGAPQRARDAARQAMLSEVAAAVETFNIDNGTYPEGDDCLTATHDGGSDMESLVEDYLNGNPPTSQVVSEISGGTPLEEVECTDSVHYTRLTNGYVVFVPQETGLGGSFDLQSLQAIAVDGPDVATVSDMAGTNAEALVK